MGVPGLNEFAKYFYPQTEKDALIVDVRSNGGGNVSPMIIERLRRELVLVDIARNGTPQTNPGAMILGPKVLLADEFSASDGDLVTYRFKTHKSARSSASAPGAAWSASAARCRCSTAAC